MSDFHNRLDVAQDHEVDVRKWFEADGWVLAHAGLHGVPPDFRLAIKRTPSLLRWMPDLMAVKDTRVLLIEAKMSLAPKHPNWCIETKSLEAAEMCEALAEVVFVFPDRTYASPALVRRWCDDYFNDPGRASATGGSGTPFMRFPKNQSLSLGTLL